MVFLDGLRRVVGAVNTVAEVRKRGDVDAQGEKEGTQVAFGAINRAKGFDNPGPAMIQPSFAMATRSSRGKVCTWSREAIRC